MRIASRTNTGMLWRYLRDHWRKAAGLSAALFGTIGLRLFNPQIVRRFIDAAQSQADLSRLTWAALTFLGIGMGAQALNMLTTYLGTNLALSTTNALRADLAAHCLNLDMTFHNEHTPGEMIERVDGDVTALSNFFSQFIIRLIGGAMMIVGVLGLLYREDWRIGLGLTLFALLTMGILLYLRRVGVEDSTAEREASAKLYGFLEERLEGLDDIRANGAGDYTMRRFYERVREFYKTGRRAFKKRTIVWRTIIFLFGQGQVLALAIGAYLYYREALTVGTVYLLYQYMSMLFQPLEEIANQVQDLQKALAGMGRVQELMAREPNIKQQGSHDNLPSGALSVAFEQVSFSYHQDRPVLENISFTLEAGKVLGLLGRTGSGKTTLARLLFRLYEPTAGTIRLGGHPIEDVPLNHLRQTVAMVTQDIQLFRATVRDNLTFFDPAVPDARIIAILQELGLEVWYANLPQGLDTELISGNEGLSAGEAQLLAFARAFLGNPSLVILDEPSSHLDPATEGRLERAMSRLLEGRTGIIIAHRLATLDRVDEIMIMGDNRIQEYGSREELVRDHQSLFYHLLATGLEEVFA